MKKKLPKGPSYFSFMLEAAPDRLQYYCELMEDFGGIVKVPCYDRGYLINDAEMIKQVLKQKPDIYLRTGARTKPMARFLGKGILMLNGSQWRTRRLAMAPFFTPTRILNYVNTIQQVTEKRLAMLADKPQNTGDYIDFSHEIMKVTYEIAVEAFFKQNLSETEIENALQAIYLDNRYSASFPGLWPNIPTLSGMRYRKARSILKQHIEDILQNARENPHTDSLINKILTLENEDGSKLSEVEIYDEAKTFLMTGHETTGSTLGFAFKLLSENPDIQDKARCEIKRVIGSKPPEFEDLKNLPYTRGIFEEAIRLYPPIWLTPRVNQVDDYLGEYFIPKNSTILISPYTLHRRQCYWEQPLDFIPERHFCDTYAKPPPFAFLPFGAGPRVCVAGHFAPVESIIIIAMVLQRFELTIHPEHHVGVEHIVTLKPKNGVLLKLRSL